MQNRTLTDDIYRHSSDSRGPCDSAEAPPDAGVLWFDRVAGRLPPTSGGHYAYWLQRPAQAVTALAWLGDEIDYSAHGCVGNRR